MVFVYEHCCLASLMTQFPLTYCRTLAEYFLDIDVVPSDFVAGLALLRKFQKHQEHVALMRAIQEQQVLDCQVCYGAQPSTGGVEK